MGKITKKDAEILAEQILEKLSNVINSGKDVNITLSTDSDEFTKTSLVKTILKNDNIYVPLKRITQFDNLQDETVRSLCNPTGKVTMTEVFNKGYKAEELLNMDITSLDVHCEGIGSKGAVSYVTPWASDNFKNNTNDFGKDYAVTYTGEGADGSTFSANAIYNTVNSNKKDYYISKKAKDTSTGATKETTNTLLSSGNYSSSEGYKDTKSIKIGKKNYSWDHFEGVTSDDFNNKLYSWEESIKETSGSTISNTVCKYDNPEYEGTPTELTITDFTTGSSYKESNGVITTATGTLSIVCKYDSNGDISLEKPTLAKITKTTKVAEISTSKIDKDCLGIVSIQTNIATGLEEVIITPNPVSIKKSTDILKIVDALKKWNIGSNSSSVSNNNIWINTTKGNTYFTEDGSYIVNSFSTLSNYLGK